MNLALVLLIPLVLLGATAAYVRLAPAPPERWHADPLVVESPRGNGWLVRDDGHEAPPRLDEDPRALLSRLDAVAAAEPRTRRIAGSVDEGRITYETRSRFWGFPDYTTVTAVSDGGAAVPVVLGRARFGVSDLGVNRARIERWLAALD